MNALTQVYNKCIIKNVINASNIVYKEDAVWRRLRWKTANNATIAEEVWTASSAFVLIAVRESEGNAAIAGKRFRMAFLFAPIAVKKLKTTFRGQATAVKIRGNRQRIARMKKESTDVKKPDV